MTGTSESAPLTPGELRLLDRCEHGLGRGTWEQPERVSVGDSGSLVLRARWSGRRVVLKITTDRDRLVRARTEQWLLAERPAGVAEAMPSYLGGMADVDLVAVVTEECVAMPPPDQLAPGGWVEIAALVGRLHAAPIPDRTFPHASSGRSRQHVAGARDFWRRRGLEGEADRSVGLLSDTRRHANSSVSPPTVLTHGDCHLENVVRDQSGHLRLVDWQEVVLTDGLGDLSFVCLRAEFAGGLPPRESMLRAYAAARGVACDADLSMALARAELSSLFFGWPPFLPHGTPEAQGRLQDRLTQLVAYLSNRTS